MLRAPTYYRALTAPTYYYFTEEEEKGLENRTLNLMEYLVESPEESAIEWVIESRLPLETKYYIPTQLSSTSDKLQKTELYLYCLVNNIERKVLFSQVPKPATERSGKPSTLTSIETYLKNPHFDIDYGLVIFDANEAADEIKYNSWNVRYLVTKSKPKTDLFVAFKNLNDKEGIREESSMWVRIDPLKSKDVQSTRKYIMELINSYNDDKEKHDQEDEFHGKFLFFYTTEYWGAQNDGTLLKRYPIHKHADVDHSFYTLAPEYLRDDISVYIAANDLVNGFVYKSGNCIKRDSLRVLKDIHDFLIERHKKDQQLQDTWACLFDFKSTDTTIVTTIFTKNLKIALTHADGLMVFGEERIMSYVKTEDQLENYLWDQYRQIQSEQKTFIIYFRLTNEKQILELCKSMRAETCTCNTRHNYKANLRCSTVDLDVINTSRISRMMPSPKAKQTPKPKAKPTP